MRAEGPHFAFFFPPYPAHLRLAGLSTARAAAESLDCCFRRNDTSTPAFG